MEQREATAVLLYERERGTAHVVWIDPQAFRQPAHESSLARAEIAIKQYDVTGLETSG